MTATELPYTPKVFLVVAPNLMAFILEAEKRCGSEVVTHHTNEYCVARNGDKYIFMSSIKRALGFRGKVLYWGETPSWALSEQAQEIFASRDY